MRVLAAAIGVALLSIGVGGQAPAAVVWQVDNLERIGGLPVEAIGAPTVVQTDAGPAVSFNGRSDGLLLDRNPSAWSTR